MSSRTARRRGERGYAAVLVAVFVSALALPLAAIAVDVARWYVEVERVQKAADAGALAGVTHMPQDLAAAQSAAQEVAGRNGYTANATTAVDAQPGARPSELEVTVSSKVENAFGKFFGIGSSTITRSAVADYTGPQPMGSPCNTYGNEPPGTSRAGPVGSQLSAPPGADCRRTPEFWFTVHGPETYKTQGDQYMTRVCQGGESGCKGDKNTEFRPEGYFLMVRVAKAAVGVPVELQLYDPAYVDTGSRCNWDKDTAFPTGNSWNPWATDDALTRYARNPNFVTVGGQQVAFCAGDANSSHLGRGSETPTITSYALRRPADDLSPLSGTPVTGCTRQFPGYKSITVGDLRQGDPGYDPQVARVFHQWVPLCTFTPDVAGDYYLQVRTNVSLGGTLDRCASTTSPGSCTASHVPGSAATSPVTQQSGDDEAVKGNGNNRFAVRAKSTAAQSISIAAHGRMPIYANTDQAAPIFNFIRVLPGAANKTLLFTFFDVGDAAGAGGATLTVLPPVEATGDPVKNCAATGFENVSLPSCSLSGIRNDHGWNGQAETISVPIPANYSCNFDSAGGCWWRVQVSFGAGQTVTDATTWTASISGDPVRLIE